MNFCRIVACALLVSQLSGCYTFTMDLPDAEASGQIVKSFKAEAKVHSVVIGLVTISNPDVQAVIAQEVKRAGGTSAKNVRIVHQMSFLDGLIGALTGTIYTPTTVSVEGDVIK